MNQRLWWRSMIRREMVAMLLIVAGCFILMYRVGQQYFPAGDPGEWPMRHLGYWALIAFILVILQRWRAAIGAVFGTAVGLALSRLIGDALHKPIHIANNESLLVGTQTELVATHDGWLIFLITFAIFIALGLWSDHRYLTRRHHRHVATEPGSPQPL